MKTLEGGIAPKAATKSRERKIKTAKQTKNPDNGTANTERVIRMLLSKLMQYSQLTDLQPVLPRALTNFLREPITFKPIVLV